MALRKSFSIVPTILKFTQNKPYNFTKLQPQITSQIIRFSSTRVPYNSQSEQIYYGVLTPQIKAVKFFSLSSSIIGIVAQPFLYNAVISTGNVPIIVAAYSFIGFFTFATPLLLHFVTKKYVTHLEYNDQSDQYTATTINFFLIPKKIEFKLDDVRVPDVPGLFTTLIAKKKPLFLEPSLFQNTDHYAKLMGYDKPIDFKLYNETDTQKPKSGNKK